MKVRELKRRIKDLRSRAMKSADKQQRWHTKWKAEGRAQAYTNVLEWLDLFDQDIELCRLQDERNAGLRT